MYGRAGGWFPGTQVRHEGHVRAGGVDKDVTFADADPDLNDQIDAASCHAQQRRNSISSG
jgi:hypothetical protein